MPVYSQVTRALTFEKFCQDPDDVPLEDELCEALEHARREIRRQDLGPVGEEAGNTNTSTRRASEAAAAGASFDVQVNIRDHLHYFLLNKNNYYIGVIVCIIIIPNHVCIIIIPNHVCTYYENTHVCPCHKKWYVPIIFNTNLVCTYYSYKY